MTADVIVIGSGPSGVHAAYPLVEAGLIVRLLDFGHEDHAYAGVIPDAPFADIRRSDHEQARYFLGNRFEGIPLGTLREGAQLTPPRRYVTKDTRDLTPIESDTFFPLESLALGGLASAWGAGAFPYTQRDLAEFPISRDDLAPHYETVAQRIGISGERDDLVSFYGDCRAMLPPLRNDTNASSLLERYRRVRTRLNAGGFYMGQPRLAALSRPYRGRGPDRYLDMSFWADTDRSVYRPRYTLEELQRFDRFSYHRPLLVGSFREQPDHQIQVSAKNMATGRTDEYRARALILAAGTFGTTRIVLRSLGRYEVQVPLVANAYTYVPMLNLNTLGQPGCKEKHSLAQLCTVYDPSPPGGPLVHAHVHSYQSLLNFKVIKELPLPYREGLRVAHLLLPSLVILAIDHEDRPNPDKFCRLHAGAAGAPDRLQIVYREAEDRLVRQRRHERAIMRKFLRLGCLPLRRIRPGPAASAHYGGTFPMTLQEKPLTTTREGRLRGTRSVYVADGSVFPYLPAKGPTFTMMANANRVGEHLAKRLLHP